MDFGPIVLIPEEQQLREDAVRPGVTVIDVERHLNLLKRVIQCRGGGYFEKHLANVGPCDVGMRTGVFRVKCDRALETLPCLRKIFSDRTPPPLVPKQDKIVGGDACGRLAAGEIATSFLQPARQG